MRIGSALLHFLGGDEDSKGLAGGVKEQVVLEQDDNREIVRQTVSDVITDRKAKKERREAIINAHATNIDALRNNNYNFENSVSIAAAGQTDNYVKYANEYGGDVNDLWNYTSNVALDTGLTTRQVAEQLTGPLIYSDIQYGDLTPSTGILGKLGIAPNLGKQVQKRVDMLSPIDPRDAEMKKLLVSGSGTAATAALEDTSTPRDFDLENEILPLLLKRGPVDKPDAMTAETVEQGNLTDTEFANLKNLLGFANREFSITQKIGAEGAGSTSVQMYVNFLSGIAGEIAAEQAMPNPDLVKLDQIKEKYSEMYNQIPDDIKDTVGKEIMLKFGTM